MAISETEFAAMLSDPRKWIEGDLKWGERLEGRGMEPDVAVPVDVRYAAGRDVQLEAAHLTD